MVSSMQNLSAGSLKALKSTSIIFFPKLCRMFPFQFSRKSETLLPSNSDFTAFKPLNFLENSTVLSILPPRNHPIPNDLSPFKLLDINALSIAKFFVAKFFAMTKGAEVPDPAPLLSITIILFITFSGNVRKFVAFPRIFIFSY